MMKRKLEILIAGLIGIFMLLFTTGNAIADCDCSVEVGSDLEIIGKGTMARDLLAQSDWGYSGQRLTETMYSRWMTTDGISNVSYSSNLNVYIGASETHEDENTTEITYAQTAFTTNMRDKVCSQNYDAGVVSGFDIVGMSGKAFEIEMLPDANYLELEAGLEGKAKLRHMIVDPDSRLKIVKETTQVEGTFDIDWNAFAENLIYPGNEGEWLGCP